MIKRLLPQARPAEVKTIGPIVPIVPDGRHG